MVPNERSSARALRTCTGALALATAQAACSIGGGVVATQGAGTSLDTRTSDWGVRAQALAQVPRDFRLTAGGEVQRDSEVHPTSVGHRWRTTAIVGYAEMPDDVGGPYWGTCGYELLGRGGYARGIGLDRGRHSIIYGGSIGIPCRPYSTRESWRADGLVTSSVMLVPELGLGHSITLPFDHPKTEHRLELYLGLSARLRVTASVFP